jgi:protein tyrosine phosphatase (PTP) superfamily phosphohydrolase (DUF442 family)
MSTSFRRLILPALVLATAAGCQCCGKKKGCDTCPPAPPPGAPIIAPPASPPPGAGVILPPAAPPPGAPAAPAPSFPSGAGYPPVASYYAPGVKLGAPSFGGSPDAVVQAPAAQAPVAQAPANPLAPAPARGQDIKLLPPEFGSSSSSSPASAPATTATPALPVGIVDFAPAIPDHVAAGRKPALDGLDWLKANGYKSVLLLRRPGQSDTADRKQVELRGLTFASIEVSPATLTWKTVDDFAKLVGDSANQPMFVYDFDGSLSGGMWYLYFRRVDRISDEAARLRATRLGLKEGTDASQKEMWLAIQKLLAQQ